MQSQSNGAPTVPASPRKKWPLITIGAGIVVGAVVAAFLLLGGNPDKKSSRPDAPAVGTKNFAVVTKGQPVRYAGHAVYDACNIISFDTVRSTVKNYQQILDMNGTDEKPSKPLVIEHEYIDRDISQPLGADGRPRPTNTKIGGKNAADANSFLSASDSNCWYGQGKNLHIGGGEVFAKVYVTQKPTPLSGGLLQYLDTLSKAGSEDGIDAYVEPQTDSGGFYTGIVIHKSKGVVVFVKAATRELGEKATVEASEKLTEDPAAPMNITYPLEWARMPDVCRLLTADDFRQATGKPAAALATDTATLNEIGGRIMQRSCQRLELERLDGSPIAKTTVMVRMGKDENAAKAYVGTLKDSAAKGRFGFTPLSQQASFADEAYVATTKKGKKVSGHELDMRIGQAVIMIGIETDAGVDASADAFAARVLPFAQKIAERYKNSL